MKKYSLAFLCILALSACDSSSTSVKPSGDSSGGNTDSGGGGDSGTGSGDGDSGAGDGGSDGGDTGTGDDGSACAAPEYGTVLTQGGSVLTDGCIDGDVIDLAAATSASLYHTLFAGVPDSDSSFDASNLPADVKGLYLYTQGSAPAFIVPYTTVGFYARAGRLGFVTRGPGVYYLSLDREDPAVGTLLNGLNLAAWSTASGAVNLTEVTLAHVDDDVTERAKLHWQNSDLSPLGSYSRNNLLTLAANAGDFRAITHELSEEVVGQYLSLIAEDCPAHNGVSEVPAVRFVDATGELGQAWSGTDVRIQTGDDPTRIIYMIAIDWAAATQATVIEVLRSIESKSYLWPVPEHPNVLNGTCAPNLTASGKYFDSEGKPTLENIEDASLTDWLH